MIFARLEPVEWGAIIAGVVIVVAFVFWRIRMNRKPKDAEEKLDTAP